MDDKPLHIILADDDESDRLLFKSAFEELKFKTIIHMVKDGKQLMEYLTLTNDPLPHLLFLDLNMPRKNGLECLMGIRSSNKLKDILIAIYSTSASESDIKETFRRGANIYIKKPDDFNVLKQTLCKAVVATFQYQQQGLNKEDFLLKI